LGDKVAMRVLYARHSLRIYRFILRLTGEVTTAEDVLSDVFLDVWQSPRALNRTRASRRGCWRSRVTRRSLPAGVG
jgi:RNA polymerase sigma-70 factor (ECF subfamily)